MRLVCRDIANCAQSERHARLANDAASSVVAARCTRCFQRSRNNKEQYECFMDQESMSRTESNCFFFFFPSSCSHRTTIRATGVRALLDGVWQLCRSATWILRRRGQGLDFECRILAVPFFFKTWSLLNPFYSTCFMLAMTGRAEWFRGYCWAWPSFRSAFWLSRKNRGNVATTFSLQDCVPTCPKWNGGASLFLKLVGLVVGSSWFLWHCGRKTSASASFLRALPGRSNQKVCAFATWVTTVETHFEQVGMHGWLKIQMGVAGTVWLLELHEIEIPVVDFRCLILGWVILIVVFWVQTATKQDNLCQVLPSCTSSFHPTCKMSSLESGSKISILVGAVAGHHLMPTGFVWWVLIHKWQLV